MYIYVYTYNMYDIYIYIHMYIFFLYIYVCVSMCMYTIHTVIFVYVCSILCLFVSPGRDLTTCGHALKDINLDHGNWRRSARMATAFFGCCPEADVYGSRFGSVMKLTCRNLNKISEGLHIPLDLQILKSHSGLPSSPSSLSSISSSR